MRPGLAAEVAAARAQVERVLRRPDLSPEDEAELLESRARLISMQTDLADPA